MKHASKRFRAGWYAAMAAGLVVAGCGSSASKVSSATTAATASANAVPSSLLGLPVYKSLIQPPAQLLAAAYKGLYTAPPTTGPKAVKGKDLWVISCGQSSTSCQLPTASLVAAAKAAGWSTHVVDGQLNPVLWAQGITQAVAGGASGVIAVSVDCNNATTALSQAKAAHVLTESYEGFDCNDPGVNAGPSLFSTAVGYHGAPNIGAYFEEWGASRAAWVINATHGQAKVVDLGIPSILSIKYEDVGFLAEMSQCSGCKVVDDVPIALTDLATNAASQKLSTALEQHPEANAVNIPSDSFFPQFVNSVLSSINRPSLQVMGGECLTANLTEIANGGPEDACSALPDVWNGWAAVDEMNRQFANPGSAPVDEGLSIQLVDKAHNMPSGGQGWAPTGVNIPQAYTSLWNG